MKFSPSLFVVFFFIFIFSCQESNKSEVTSVSEKELDLISTSMAENTFKALSDAEQWDFLVNIVGKVYKNSSEVKDWIDNKIEQKIKSPSGISPEVINKLSSELYFGGYIDQATKLANFSMHSSWGKENIKDKSITALILTYHFKVFNEMDSLVKYNDVLLNCMKKDTSHLLSVAYYTNQAVIDEKRGDFFQSVVNYKKAIEATPLSDTKNLAFLYHDLALTYLDLEYFDKSLQYMNLSLKYKPIEAYPLNQMNSIAVIYSKSKALNEAEAMFKSIVIQAKEDRSYPILAQAYSNYGNLKRKQKDFISALELMKKSDSICTEIGLDFGVLINHINRAEVYHDQGLHQKAANELEKGRLNLKEINDIKLNKEFYHLYYRIEDALDNKIAANSYYRLYNENKNQYFGDLPKTIIAEWELENQRNNALKKEAEYSLHLEKKNRNILFVWFLLLLVVLLTMISYLYINRRNLKEKRRLELEKQKIAYELEMKSKELLADTLKNITIASIKDTIYKEIQDVLSKLPKTHQGDLAKLAKKMKQTENVSVLEEFNTRFTGVYESFYKRLKDIAPDLTPSELNICALIRLNLTSKEIAVLTNRTERTVENIRVSIRKKLKLSSDSNLQQELFNIP